MGEAFITRRGGAGGDAIKGGAMFFCSPGGGGSTLINSPRVGVIDSTKDLYDHYATSGSTYLMSTAGTPKKAMFVWSLNNVVKCDDMTGTTSYPAFMIEDGKATRATISNSAGTSSMVIEVTPTFSLTTGSSPHWQVHIQLNVISITGSFSNIRTSGQVWGLSN